MNKCCYKLNFSCIYRAYRPQAIYTILHIYLLLNTYISTLFIKNTGGKKRGKVENGVTAHSARPRIGDFARWSHSRIQCPQAEAKKTTTRGLADRRLPLGSSSISSSSSHSTWSPLTLRVWRRRSCRSTARTRRTRRSPMNGLPMRRPVHRPGSFPGS